MNSRAPDPSQAICPKAGQAAVADFRPRAQSASRSDLRFSLCTDSADFRHALLSPALRVDGSRNSAIHPQAPEAYRPGADWRLHWLRIGWIGVAIRSRLTPSPWRKLGRQRRQVPAAQLNELPRLFGWRRPLAAGWTVNLGPGMLDQVQSDLTAARKAPAIANYAAEGASQHRHLRLSRRPEINKQSAAAGSG